MTKEKKIPKKGAGRKWAARLKELAERDPPPSLVKKINARKVAKPTQKHKDLDL